MVSSRELAALIWIAIFVIWALTQDSIRSALKNVVRSFLEPKIIGVIVVYAVYIAVWAWLGSVIGIWTDSLLKDTVIWFLIAGFPILFKWQEAGRDDRFFVKAVQSTFALSVLLEFLMNVTSFHLVVEFVLLPVIVVLATVDAFASLKDEYRPAKRFCEVLLGIIGIALFAFTARQIYSQRSELEYEHLARSLALNVWLPIVALPFLYLFALYAAYELAFVRMGSSNRRQAPHLRAKLATIVGLRGRIRDVQSLVGKWSTQVATAPTFRSALEQVRAYRLYRDEERAESEQREYRLKRYAGSDATDDEGKRLDQREFDATRAALRLIASSQEAFYENNRGRYRSDALDVITSPRMPLSSNLPVEHGVQVIVRRDGKAWYAWRRTISGWTFAIGATSKPPDRWFYDGANPPLGYPSAKGGWDHLEPGINSTNWDCG